MVTLSELELITKRSFTEIVLIKHSEEASYYTHLYIFISILFRHHININEQ